MHAKKSAIDELSAAVDNLSLKSDERTRKAGHKSMNPESLSKNFSKARPETAAKYVATGVQSATLKKRKNPAQQAMEGTKRLRQSMVSQSNEESKEVVIDNNEDENLTVIAQSSHREPLRPHRLNSEPGTTSLNVTSVNSLTFGKKRSNPKIKVDKLDSFETES